MTTFMDELPSKRTRSQCKSSHHSPAHPAHTIPSNILPPVQNVNLETTNAGISPHLNASTIHASLPGPHTEDPRDGPPSKRTRSSKKQESRHPQQHLSQNTQGSVSINKMACLPFPIPTPAPRMAQTHKIVSRVLTERG
eukprot:165021-Pelagomonas_calceolata.AAC.1